MKLDKSKYNWYGFKHSGVSDKFSGGLTYVGTFCVNGEYAPVAVYKAAKPNKEKGHKKYMLLQVTNHVPNELCVRGMSAAEMAAWRYHVGIICNKCQEVLYSVNRHDFRACDCGATKVDGGREYLRYLGDIQKIQVVNIDLFTGKVMVD